MTLWLPNFLYMLYMYISRNLDHCPLGPQFKKKKQYLYCSMVSPQKQEKIFFFFEVNKFLNSSVAAMFKVWITLRSAAN